MFSLRKSKMQGSCSIKTECRQLTAFYILKAGLFDDRFSTLRTAECCFLAVVTSVSLASRWDAPTSEKIFQIMKPFSSELDYYRRMTVIKENRGEMLDGCKSINAITVR